MFLHRRLGELFPIADPVAEALPPELMDLVNQFASKDERASIEPRSLKVVDGDDINGSASPDVSRLSPRQVPQPKDAAQSRGKRPDWKADRDG